MKKINAHFDQLPPAALCPPGWDYSHFSTRTGALIAADYWEERHEANYAEWLRTWSALATDDIELATWRVPKSVTRAR